MATIAGSGRPLENALHMATLAINSLMTVFQRKSGGEMIKVCGSGLCMGGKRNTNENHLYYQREHVEATEKAHGRDFWPFHHSLYSFPLLLV